ncbi:unnamed protein product [Allacma fusca]|uniref:HDAg domain-containing protein n=1 Tax=Allacma fusca TaxID=39272 RepID=A0A8J2LC90_9HEXA|nr:unnamed protein product [Allacma fusca]
MANVRDSDTSLWLHNKLGSSDSWTTGSISSQLNSEVLRNIKECFIDLQGPVKVKLLLSFFHIPKRNMDDWRMEIEDILEVAQADSEQWVAMLAEIMKSYPATSCLNLEITEPEENRRIFLDLVDEVTKELRRGKEVNLLPMECHYVNKSVLTSIVGPQKAPQKHFKVKKQTKSSTLRYDLVCKATDAAKTSAKKVPAPTIPLRTRGMPRKMTDTTPLKGLPSQAPPMRSVTTPGSASRTLSRTPAGKKEGGVKLLEITEQPVGYALAKRRKKMQEIEDSKKSVSQEEPAPPVNETPDYAAGLSGTGRSASPPPPATPLPLLPPPTPSPYAPPPTPQPLTPSTPTPPIATPFSRANSIPDGPPPTPNPQLPTKSEPSPPAPVPVVTQAPSYLPVAVTPAANPARKVQTQVTHQTMTKTVILQVPTNPTQQVVTLSKELMEQAQEIFRTANKATRPEKEHILKFMAGTRENPCPELGSIVTIKLSEHDEPARQPDGALVSMSVETHFQMNYNTGIEC